jgi:hypothetical protein
MQTPLEDFVGRLDAAKGAAERQLGIERYPFASLNNLAQIEALCAAAAMRIEDLHSEGRILDLGCGDGDLGFWLSGQGRPVDLVDFAETNQNRMEMVKALAAALPGQHRVFEIDIDRGLRALDSLYSFTCALGLIYHLQNPFLVLSDLAALSSFAVINTRIVDGALLPEGLASAYLVSEKELGPDNTNYWLFNSKGFRLLAERSGWTVLSSLRSGDQKAGDAGGHDAREALLLASKYSVFGAVVLRSGFHRVEYGTFRWTERRFALEANCGAAGDFVLHLRYFLPETWAGLHRLEARIAGEELVVESAPAGNEVLARVSFRVAAAGRVLLDFACEGVPDLEGDERSLGLVLRFDSGLPPVWLEGK